jgi:hypothetical protein
MGLFSKKKKASKKKGNDSEALLKEQRQSPPVVAEPPIRTFDTFQKQVQPSLLGDDSSLEDVYVPDNKVYTTQPPPARQSAFHGPPRFDWIDIVRFWIASILVFYIFCNHSLTIRFNIILGNQCGS